MARAVDLLTRIADRIARFAGADLGSTIAGLESQFTNLNKRQIEKQLKLAAIERELFDSARTLKRAAAQIDVVIHALGILVILPTILEPGEKIESLSLGAGSTRAKRFDLETDRRVAEFTFIEWRGRDSTRLQKIFKDFYRLAEYRTRKKKELWLTDDASVRRFFSGKKKIRSATYKHRDVWENFKAKYPRLIFVKEYYESRGNHVAIRKLIM
jgi:hypothetical protein